MSEPETIVCRPTKWFLWRAIAMTAMFAFFSAWFLKDWKSGYPAKNELFFSYRAFETAKEAFSQQQKAGQGASEWAAFIEARTMGDLVADKVAEDAQRRGQDPPAETPVYPGIVLEDPWPSILADYEAYRSAYQEDKDKTAPPLWVSYSNERGWSSKRPEKSFDRDTVQEQLHWAIGAAVLTLVVVFFLFRTLGRSMKVDEEAYYAPNGARIPFESMRRIDSRKWKTKGMASITYEDGGETKRAKVDGMVYGQFKEEDGEPAERLFQHILKRFSGELVELEDDEDEDGEQAAPEDSPASPKE